jgi:hypothetical protein
MECIMTTNRDLCHLNFLATADAKGNRYVRGYKNVWVPGKDGKRGGSRMSQQVYVGALQANGHVPLSEKFLEKFPQFAGTDWYYEKNTLYSADEFEKMHPEAVSVATSAEVQETEDAPSFKHFGATYGLRMMAHDSEMLESMEAACDKKTSEVIFGQALYNILGRGSASSFKDWAQDHYLHADACVSDQRVSEAFSRISSETLDTFFQERYERSLKTSGGQLRYCALDSTSISVTSGSVDHAEYGYAKQDKDLKQINLVAVMDQMTGELIYATEYNGSINDISSFTYICKKMKRLGMDLSQIVFVADRGYCSNFNQDYLLHNGASFVMGRKIDSRSSLYKLLTAKKPPSSKDLHSTVTIRPEIRMHAFTTIEKFRIDNQTVDVYTHLYRDPIRAVAENMNRRECVYNMVQRANNCTDDSFKKHPDWREAGAYMRRLEVKTNGEHQRGEMQWFPDNGKLLEAERAATCFAISSNVQSDPIKALQTYRARNTIEVGFRIFKQDVDERFHTSGCGYYGKLWCYLVAWSLLLMIRTNALNISAADDLPVRLPHNSVPELLSHLETIHISRRRAKDLWLVDKLTKQQRLYFTELLKVKTPPQKL